VGPRASLDDVEKRKILDLIRTRNSDPSVVQPAASHYRLRCNPLKVNRRFRGTYCLHLQGQRINQTSKLRVSRVVRHGPCMSAYILLIAGCLVDLLFDPEDGSNFYHATCRHFSECNTVHRCKCVQGFGGKARRKETTRKTKLSVIC
jgi:hypothetical protein